MLPTLLPVEVTYGLAVISWCPDLTDPQAQSEPVAVVLIGQVGQRWYAATATKEPFRTEQLDELTRSVLNEMPNFIDRRVAAAVQASVQPSVEGLLNQLHDALRGSLSISKIMPTETATLTLATLPWLLAEQARRLLYRADSC